MIKDITEFKEMGKYWSNSTKFLDKYMKSREVVREQLERFDKPYICCSGGKDSVVLALLVADVIENDMKGYNGDIFLWSHVSDASYPGTIETIKKVSERTGLRLVLDESPVSAFENISEEDVKQFGKKGYFFSAIEKCIKENERNLAFVGVRAYESRRRMKAVKAHGMAFTSHVPAFCNICYPLAWYKLEDIAAATFIYDAPIHPIYTKMDTRLVNKSNEEGWIRLGYLTAKDLLNYGTAVFIKRNYPEQFRKLCEAYPEIKKYV